jgi:hypothetical protein
MTSDDEFAASGRSDRCLDLLLGNTMAPGPGRLALFGALAIVAAVAFTTVTRP